ncbi:hypothetical protein BD770DRAFT_403878 [Pilaira anomala]|nr:hypothetical protein BD770DRAFT_403878 [Pilaira anomala]
MSNIEIVTVNQQVAKFKSVSILGQKYNSLEATSFREQQLELTTLTFAYVRWYKDLNPGSHITTFDTINSSCYSNTFTDPSYMDILPVHCIHSPIGLYINVIDSCNIVINMPRRITE